MKKNDYILLTIISLLQINVYSQGTWKMMQSPTDNFLNSVCFIDSLYGWAAGDSGSIIHTTDGGLNWVIQSSNTLNRITALFFLNKNLGFASALEVTSSPYGTYLLKTNDGGENWISSSVPIETIFAQCLFFQDSLNGWMGGRPTPILRTTDSGLSWFPAEIDSSAFASFPVYDIQFYNSDFGVASGGVLDCCGIIWWTTNGGNNWQVIDTSDVAPEPVYKVYIKDSLNVIGVGGDFEPLGFGVGIMNTSNSGLNWDFEYIGISGVAWDIDFRTNYEAWAPLGGEKKLIYSLDSGVSWHPTESPDSAIIYDIDFSDSLHGFGVGSEGALIKYQHPNIIGVAQSEEIPFSDFTLYQNYPNPFNPETIINYYLSKDSFIKLSVFNLLGQEITKLVHSYQEAGSHEIKFNAENLSGGVYFYSLESAGFREMKKMVILR